MWKDIKDWEGLYEINELGQARNVKTKYLLPPTINSAGYSRVTLYRKGKGKHYLLHRLVAIHFLPNPDNLPEVNHKDGDKSHNYSANLEWCTRTQNERHSHQNGSKKYTPFVVHFKDDTIKEYNFTIDLATEIGVSKRTVMNYLTGKSKNYSVHNIQKIFYI